MFNCNATPDLSLCNDLFGEFYECRKITVSGLSWIRFAKLSESQQDENDVCVVVVGWYIFNISNSYPVVDAIALEKESDFFPIQQKMIPFTQLWKNRFMIEQYSCRFTLISHLFGVLLWLKCLKKTFILNRMKKFLSFKSQLKLKHTRNKQPQHEWNKLIAWTCPTWLVSVDAV